MPPELLPMVYRVRYFAGKSLVFFGHFMQNESKKGNSSEGGKMHLGGTVTKKEEGVLWQNWKKP